MASRTIRVQFLPDTVAGEVVADPEVHDISINDDVQGVPAILENPHVDFPGMWQLVDDESAAVPGRTGIGADADLAADAGPGTAVAAGTDDRVGSVDDGAVHRYARYDQVGQTNNVRVD